MSCGTPDRRLVSRPTTAFLSGVQISRLGLVEAIEGVRRS
jgi:hypothetical protein